jgi:hypothetical protein
MTKTQVAIQGVCAWPNLMRLPDGTLLAIVFNQPCHGRWEGDVDCWASTDNGESWRFRGRPAPHEAGANRMNVAAGPAANGDVLVLASGWSHRGKPYEEPVPFSQASTLAAWVCRSSDQGRTWRKTGVLPKPPADATTQYIPFGKIERAEDGSLRVSAYMGISSERNASYMLASADDGNTWTLRSMIAENRNETDLLPMGGGRWLAIARGAIRHQDNVNLFESLDDGKSWSPAQPLSLPRQHPGHLLRLADGRLLATYGNRCPGAFGVDARMSWDNGSTWLYPIRVSSMTSNDGGYPASVQLADGSVVTAFYQQVSGPYHYEMVVTSWNPDDHDPFKAQKKQLP